MEQLKKTRETLKKTMKKWRKTWKNGRKPWNNWRKPGKHWRKPTFLWYPTFHLQTCCRVACMSIALWSSLLAGTRPFIRYLLGSQESSPDVWSPRMYEHCVMEHLNGTLRLSRYPKSSCDLICIGICCLLTVDLFFDIWPSLPCLQTRTSLTCISIPRNLFFFDANFIFFWCVYHVEILDSSIEVQGNIFFWCKSIFILILMGIFFLMRFYFFDPSPHFITNVISNLA